MLCNVEVVRVDWLVDVLSVVRVVQLVVIHRGEVGLLVRMSYDVHVRVLLVHDLYLLHLVVDHKALTHHLRILILNVLVLLCWLHHSWLLHRPGDQRLLVLSVVDLVLL